MKPVDSLAAASTVQSTENQSVNLSYYLTWAKQQTAATTRTIQSNVEEKQLV